MSLNERPQSRQYDEPQTNPEDELEIYTIEDIQKWKEGGKQFRDFVKKNSIDILKYDEETVAEIQALFIGEKPSCLHNSFAQNHKLQLEEFGFKFTDKFCYSPVLVQAVIEKYKNAIHFISEDSETLMQKLSEISAKEQDSIFGLVLGFPLTSTLNYDAIHMTGISNRMYSLLDILPEEEQLYLKSTYFMDVEKEIDIFDWVMERFIKYQDKLGLNAYDLSEISNKLKVILDQKLTLGKGSVWIDLSPSIESRLRFKRLHTSFREAGFIS